MKANIGLIIAAGKQTRFNNDYPKALMTKNNICLLDVNYENMKKYCDRAYVVCSFENQHYFDDKKYKKIVINSGLGSGDAILRALKVLSYNKDDSVIITWGDALINHNVYEILLERYIGKALVPCIEEDNPYVQIIPNEGKLSVLFSKYGDAITKGFHDMCIFMLPLEDLFNNLRLFYKKFYNTTIKLYEHKHGNEFEFLDIFNETNIQADIVEIDESYKTFSFNTIEEFNNYKGE